MSFKRAVEIDSKTFKLGFPQIDELIEHRKGIFLLRTNSRRLAFELGSRALLKNLEPGKKELFLHFVEYHDRYWTIDLDSLTELAERMNISYKQVTDSIYCIRAFSSDQIDEENNWNSIKELVAKDTSLIVVDSMEELHRSRYGEKSNKGLNYVLGKLHQAGMKSEAPVLVFDYSTGGVGSYLFHLANTIIRADLTDKGLDLSLKKGAKEQKSRNRYKTRVI